MRPRSLLARFRRAAGVTGLAMLGVPGVAHGQTVLGVPAGVRVRVIIADSLRQAPFASRSQSVMGTLERETADSLYLRVGGSAPFGLSRAEVRRIDVSRGVSRGRSAAVQGVAFAIVGAVVGYAAREKETTRWQRAGELAAVSAGAGIVMGLVSPFETWRRVRR